MKTLLKKHNKNSIGLIGHTIIGYPSFAICREAIAIMVEAGVNLIELQIPFSEPVADGPLFTAANHEALAAGVTVKQCFDFMHEVSQQYKIPFVFMTYANIIFKKGFENFVKEAIAVGARGAIIGDLPLENAKEYLAACKKYQFAPIQLIPPNVSEERLPKLAHASKGFIYAVARAGVTGKQTEFGNSLANFIQRIQKYSNLPIAVGFGITSPKDVEFLKPIADYAIVGSQALRVLQKEGLLGLQKFWQDLKNVSCGVAKAPDPHKICES
jgi:tryptophan synthase alpha chain